MIRGAVPTVKISEPGRTPLHLVLRRPIEVGRDCDGVLLADPELSRRHLRLSATGGRVTVQDLDSTNGTTIDGSRVAGPTAVQVGQVVNFGRCRLEVVGSDPDGARDGLVVDRLRQSSIDLVAAAAAADSFPPMLDDGGTLTFVFSDIDPADRRADGLRDERWMALLEVHKSVVRRQVQRAGGTEVKAHGDGFMLAFPSARVAVAWSIEVMRAFETHGRSRPADAFRVRIGMHVGEAIAEDGNLFGPPVVFAARVANQARGGEILVSSLVREIVESRGEFTFGEARVVQLRGFAGGQRVHPVDWMSRDG